MFRSWRIGTAFGIPLYLHPTIVLLPALIFATQWDGGWFNAAVMTALTAALFGCVLLHELGHAVTARWFGIRTRDITLYPIGGVASLERMTEKPLQEMAIAVAGPAVNVVIVCLLLPLAFYALATGLLRPEGLTAFRLDEGLAVTAVKFAFLLTAMNAGLVVFNLLPAFPMDGGRVFRALLALLMDRVRATEIACGRRPRPGVAAYRRRPRLSLYGIRHPDSGAGRRLCDLRGPHGADGRPPSGRAGAVGGRLGGCRRNGSSNPERRPRPISPASAGTGAITSGCCGGTAGRSRCTRPAE